MVVVACRPGLCESLLDVSMTAIGSAAWTPAGKTAGAGATCPALLSAARTIGVERRIRTRRGQGRQAHLSSATPVRGRSAPSGRVRTNDIRLQHHRPVAFPSRQHSIFYVLRRGSWVVHSLSCSPCGGVNLSSTGHGATPSLSTCLLNRAIRVCNRFRRRTKKEVARTCREQIGGSSRLASAAWRKPTSNRPRNGRQPLPA